MKFHERKKMSNNADIEYSLKEELLPIVGKLNVQRLSMNSQKGLNTDRSPGGMNNHLKSPKERESRSMSQRFLNMLPNANASANVNELDEPETFSGVANATMQPKRKNSISNKSVSKRRKSLKVPKRVSGRKNTGADLNRSMTQVSKSRSRRSGNSSQRVSATIAAAVEDLPSPKMAKYDSS